jgi:hypothetical protein
MSSDSNLKGNLDQTEWSWLKPHVLRDAVILVHESLEVLIVGSCVEKNNSVQVQEWISKGLLTKPSKHQIQFWDENPTHLFISLIVQPYVLAQEVKVEKTIH